MKHALLSLVAAQALLAADPGLHIPYEKYTLPNGLRVVLARDTAVPVASVYLVYEVGARSEEQGEAGYAHLFEHMMFAGDYRKQITESGGDLNASTHVDYTEFFETLPAERLNLALFLEAGRMRSLAIDRQALRVAAAAIEEEKLKSLAQPYRAAITERWPALIFSNPRNTAAVIPSADDLKTATVESVTKFHRSWYAPNNAVLAVAGDFESGEVKKLIAGYFGDIPSATKPKRPETEETARTAGKTDSVRDPNANAPAVIVGWPAPPRHSADWYALSMIDAVLTAGPNARLKLTMGEGRNSLLQGDFNLGWPAASPIDVRDPAYYDGIIVFRPNFQAAEILDQYRNEIDRIVREGVGRAELDRLKDYLRFTKLGSLQTSLSRAKVLATHELIDGDAGFADKDYAALLSVTAEQMTAAARKYLGLERRDSLIVEPAGAGK